jgi:protein transport protein SEC61 subunit alpha
VQLEEKLFWTGMALLMYLVASQVPLWGMKTSSSNDAFYIMRMILASQKGTLMELGISPIITSGMIMQLLIGAQIIEVDLDIPKDRVLYNAAGKILGLLITVGEALAYVLAGNYGAVAVLGTVKCVALILQLVTAGFVVLMLDDLLSKGWGLGSGLNLFIVTNICESVVWACLSPMTLTTGSGGSSQFEGAVTNFFYVVIKDSNKGKALYDAFFRPDLPNLCNVLATVTVFCAVTYAQAWTNVKTQIKQRNAPKGQPASGFPIKLFYTSNMPIILLSALMSTLYFSSQTLSMRYKNNPLVRLLGVWEEKNGRSRPTWGLSFLLSPPQSLLEVLAEPFHAVFYISFMLVMCALFAKAWIEISGSGPRAVEKQLRAQNLDTYPVRGAKGFAALGEKISTAAALGGMCVAALTISADLLGAIGSGTGILMAVTIIYDMYEKLEKEGGLQPLFDKYFAESKKEK